MAVGQAVMPSALDVGALERPDRPVLVSPGQHPAPAPAVRPQPTAVAEPDLSPQALAELLTDLDTDPVQYELRAADDHTDTDRIGDAIRDDDGWGLALDDPYRWTT